ncbi:MAG: tetratricopeptide repeat protein [Alphaproteobacteria bacterium]|nr:tetratricopeptide repeat protein [Alphaproteobacteria bacterium]
MHRDVAPTIDPGAFYRRHDALIAEGRPAEAAAEMERLAALRPDDPIAHYRIGCYRHESSGLAAALPHYLRAAACDVSGHHALIAKGAAARVAGLAAVAEQALRAALAIDPGHAHTLIHLATLYVESDRYAEAADLLDGVNEAGGTSVDVNALHMLALALAGRGAAFQERVRSWARHGVVDGDRLYRFARQLDDYGASDLARVCCDIAAEYGGSPEIGVYAAMLLSRVPSSGAAVDGELTSHGDRLAALAESPVRLSPPPPWLGREVRIRHFFCARPDRSHGVAVQRACLAVSPELAWTAPHCAAWRDRALPQRLRIGFLAPRWFPMLWGLARNLDRTAFEVVHLDCFDGTMQPLAEWAESVDRTVALSGLPLAEARAMIAGAELDVIVSTPHVALAYQLGYARLAPVQCSLCEPAWSDGVPTHDYYISWSRAEPPRPERDYVSATALLDRPPYWLERDHCRPEAVSRGDFDLPSAARWYVCPQSQQKLHPEFDATLAEILRRDPGGIVVLLHGEWYPAKLFRQRLRTALGDLAARVHFLPTLPPARCHGLLQIADAVLDSWPIGGMWSAYTAAMLAVPAVTLPSDIPFGRWMAAIYEWIGVTDVIARDEADYVRLALRLAHEPAWRQEISARLADRRAVLFEDAAALRELEGFLQAAASAAHRGEAPRSWRAGGFVEPARTNAPQPVAAS